MNHGDTAITAKLVVGEPLTGPPTLLYYSSASNNHCPTRLTTGPSWLVSTPSPPQNDQQLLCQIPLQATASLPDRNDLSRQLRNHSKKNTSHHYCLHNIHAASEQTNCCLTAPNSSQLTLEKSKFMMDFWNPSQVGYFI